MTALNSNYEDYNTFIKVFRRYYYLGWIAGFTLARIKQTSFYVIKYLKESKPIDFIKVELESNRSQNETVKRAIGNLKGDIYFESWFKPLLFMIEYNQTNDRYLNFWEMTDRNIQVEHILPRAYMSKGEWKDKINNPKDVDPWINTGAKLTLLSGKKNQQASNNGFESKIQSYRGKGFYAESSEGITACRITQQIVNDFDNGKFQKNGTMNH